MFRENDKMSRDGDLPFPCRKLAAGKTSRLQSRNLCTTETRSHSTFFLFMRQFAAINDLRKSTGCSRGWRHMPGDRQRSDRENKIENCSTAMKPIRSRRAPLARNLGSNADGQRYRSLRSRYRPARRWSEDNPPGAHYTTVDGRHTSLAIIAPISRDRRVSTRVAADPVDCVLHRTGSGRCCTFKTVPIPTAPGFARARKPLGGGSGRMTLQTFSGCRSRLVDA